MKAWNLISNVLATSSQTMHILDSQLGDQIRDLDIMDYGFTLLENGILFPSTSWKTLEAHWFVMCNCGKCAHAKCPCWKATVGLYYSVFCKCRKTEKCRNPFNWKDSHQNISWVPLTFGILHFLSCYTWLWNISLNYLLFQYSFCVKIWTKCCSNKIWCVKFSML